MTPPKDIGDPDDTDLGHCAICCSRLQLIRRRRIARDTGDYSLVHRQRWKWKQYEQAPVKATKAALEACSTEPKDVFPSHSRPADCA